MIENCLKTLIAFAVVTSNSQLLFNLLLLFFSKKQYCYL